MPRQIGLIAAMDPTGIIGVDGRIPWNYPSDLKRFKALTMGGILIMGRRTFESIGRRHLPGRTTFVVSSTQQEGTETFYTVEAALYAAVDLMVDETITGVWFVGGSQIYRHVLENDYVDFADITLVPPVFDPKDEQKSLDVATFPIELLSRLTIATTTSTETDPLVHRRYERT